jgi:hypothetical protein
MLLIPRDYRRPAMTLAKFLIAIAVIAMVIGFLLPAVHTIREAAHRMTCANHLKEIGQGFHRYHDARGYLPDGGKNQCDLPYHPLMTPGERDDCDHARFDAGDPYGRDVPYCPKGPLDVRRSEWSWPYQILPYLGQFDLFNNPCDAAVIATPLPGYHCPARRPARLYAGHAGIDYAGCAGTNGANGMVIRRGMEPITLANVMDGLSNTVMVGEKRLKRDRFGVSYDDNESWAEPGWDTEIYRQATIDLDRPASDLGPSPDIGRTDPAVFADIDSGLEQFGSSHVKGINVLMGDGAVRFVRFHPSPQAFQRYCVRNDGEMCNPIEF